ncbi:hypothetical protein M9H77_17523 [Catharanthus roseus]|uniref:Uncharacterized protein n=1 Tax=Catharanthus roseus TaxID=4058 RepID=A0ACC0B4T0_CATRO|nr:hypothetical protein M9H77_17523 [Catharanthus roseus]
MKEKESLFEEHERLKEEKGSANAKERHYKSPYFLELLLDSLLSEEICLLSNQINPFLALTSSYVQNFQAKRKKIGGKLHHHLNKTSISFSSNFFPMSIGFSFKELKLFLNSG